MVHELGFKYLNFLLPDYSHDSLSENTDIERNIGDYLCQLFRYWAEDDNVSVKIKKFNTALYSLTHNKQTSSDFESNQLIVISSNGNVIPDDTLRNTKAWSFRVEPNVFKNTLYEVFNSEIFLHTREGSNTIPDSCRSCYWKNVCKGGDLVNRYSKLKKFNNSSIFCKGLKEFYTEVASYLLSNNVSVERINECLS